MLPKLIFKTRLLFIGTLHTAFINKSFFLRIISARGADIAFSLQSLNTLLGKIMVGNLNVFKGDWRGN